MANLWGLGFKEVVGCTAAYVSPKPSPSPRAPAGGLGRRDLRAAPWKLLRAGITIYTYIYMYHTYTYIYIYTIGSYTQIYIYIYIYAVSRGFLGSLTCLLVLRREGRTGSSR